MTLPQQEIPKGGSFLIQETEPSSVFTPEDFTEDQKLIAQTARDFMNREAVPKLEQIESQNWEVILGLMRKAGELGLLSIDIPEEYGGLGLDKTSSMLISENMAKVGSFAVTHGGHTGIGTLPIVYFGTEEQKKKYLPKFATGEWISSYSLTEPDSGSDALSIKTSATLSQDGKTYLLNGSKSFLTNAGIADVYITFAKIDGEKMTGFIVEKGLSGIQLGKEEKKMGIKGSSTRTVILENVSVPAENVLGEIGKGHKIAFNILNMGRFKLGAGVIGGAKQVITDAAQYAKQRKQFQKAISEFGMIKEMLGEMGIRAFVGESMVYRTAGLIDRIAQKSDGKNPQISLSGIEEYAIECSIIKVYATEILSYVTDQAVQIFGGYGFMEEYPVARAYRDSRINRIFEGTNEINRLLMIGMLLKRGMEGKIPLLQAAQKAASELTEGSPPEESSDLFSHETWLLRNCKKLLLFAASLAFQKYGTQLEEEEELIERLSNMLMEIYAMESLILRVKKRLEKQKDKIELYSALVNCFLNDTILRMEVLGKQVFAAVSEGDMLRIALTALRKWLKHNPVNTIPLRRKIADAIIESGVYCF
jgi:alkylation response protein AidB-like acyl-CoA dehydrogenase